MNFTMAQVVYLDPIDHVSGKLSKKSRVTYMYKADTDRKYTQIRGKRTTPYTAAELARFDKFASVSRSTANVMKTPNLLNVAMTEFAAQTTYKKLRSYVWHREWENYQGYACPPAPSLQAPSKEAVRGNQDCQCSH